MVDAGAVQHLVEVDAAEALIVRLRAPVANPDVWLFVPGARHE